MCTIKETTASKFSLGLQTHKKPNTGIALFELIEEFHGEIINSSTIIFPDGSQAVLDRENNLFHLSQPEVLLDEVVEATILETARDWIATNREWLVPNLGAATHWVRQVEQSYKVGIQVETPEGSHAFLSFFVDDASVTLLQES